MKSDSIIIVLLDPICENDFSVIGASVDMEVRGARGDGGVKLLEWTFKHGAR